jgi:uncharacterized membrane protein YqhA
MSAIDENTPAEAQSVSVGRALSGKQVSWPMRLIGQIASGLMFTQVVATMLAAVGLMIYGVMETWQFLLALFFTPDKPLTHDQAMLEAIELVDLFLLSTVVQVVSLGLYQLFFNQNLNLPGWLKIRTLDDLKSKLVGVSVTVLAVYFLGDAVTSDGSIELLYLGCATAVVIVALTWFLSTIHKH